MLKMFNHLRWSAATLIIAALPTLSCSVPKESNVETINASEIPFDLNSPNTTISLPTSTIATSTTIDQVATTIAPEFVSELVDLYFLSTRGIVKTQLQLTSPANVAETLAALVSGPPNNSISTGLRSAIPTFFEASVTVTRGVVMVDTTASFFENLSPADQKLAIAQLVLTLTSRPGIGQVLFSVGLNPISIPRGRGDLAPAGLSVSFDDYANLVVPDTGA